VTIPVEQTVWVRLITLKYPGTCVVCDRHMLVGSTGWHDPTRKKMTCTSCRPADTNSALDQAAAIEPPLPQPPVIDSGTPGAAARQEAERRSAKRERRIEERYGTGMLGRAIKFISDDPPSTKHWERGADGEVALGRRLNEELDGHALVLHDRRRPPTTANIDHIVIAPTGVWVIDAKNWKGDVERRNIGGWFRDDYRLYVNRRDRTQTTRALDKQTAAVAGVLAPLGCDSVPMHPCMCFVGAVWPLFGSHQFEINGVFISSPAKLVLKILGPGTLAADTIQMIAVELSDKLPPAA